MPVVFVVGHSVHHPFLLGRGVNLQPNFQKGKWLDKTSTFRGGYWERRGDFFRGGGGGGGCNSYIKSKLKSEIFDDKKSL